MQPLSPGWCPLDAGRCRDSCPNSVSPAPEVCPRSSLLQRQEPQHAIRGKIGGKLQCCCNEGWGSGDGKGDILRV